MTLAQTTTAKVFPIAKKKRKLTAAEKAHRKEARMNVKLDVVDELRLTGEVYYADYSVTDMAQRHGLISIQFMFSIMSVARPYKSDSCNQFVCDLVGIIRGLVESQDVYVDGMGNVIVAVGEQQTTLWSCHTDTIHPKHTGYADLAYDSKYVTSKDKRQLGADDGVGIWLMLNMIEAGVDGLYIFHAGEEVGGLGSSYIARNTPELLVNITHAIAFDRKSTNSVITHMGFGGRCCSNEFATDFANKLNIGLFPDSTGVYTDTAEYTNLVAECTNISAGYYSEHTFSEYLDYSYAEKLLNALLKAHKAGELLDMVVHRDPDSIDVYDDYPGWDDYDGTAINNYGNSINYVPATKSYDRKGGAAYGTELGMVELVKTHPHGIVSLLKEFGIDSKYIAEYIGLSV